ncbi:MAG: hypothetical protein ACE5JJ_01350 [Nitrospinota bacterium]
MSVGLFGFSSESVAKPKVSWQQLAFLGGPPVDAKAGIRHAIEDALTAFAADWNRANPGKRI